MISHGPVWIEIHGDGGGSVTLFVNQEFLLLLQSAMDKAATLLNATSETVSA